MRVTSNLVEAGKSQLASIRLTVRELETRLSAFEQLLETYSGVCTAVQQALRPVENPVSFTALESLVNIEDIDHMTPNVTE